MIDGEWTLKNWNLKSFSVSSWIWGGADHLDTEEAFWPWWHYGVWGALSAHTMAAECWEEELEALPTAEERGVRDTWQQSYSSIGEEPVWPLLWLQAGPLPLCKPLWKREMTETHLSLSLPTSLSFIHFLSANVKDCKYNLQWFQPGVHVRSLNTHVKWRWQSDSERLNLSKGLK